MWELISKYLNHLEALDSVARLLGRLDRPLTEPTIEEGWSLLAESTVGSAGWVRAVGRAGVTGGAGRLSEMSPAGGGVGVVSGIGWVKALGLRGSGE